MDLPAGANVDEEFVDNITLDRWINQGYAELVDLLTAQDPDWYLADDEIVGVPGQLEYELPSDFFQLRGVDLESVRNGRTTSIPLEPFTFTDRHRHQHTYFNEGHSRPRYRVIRKGISGSETRLRFDGDPGDRTFRVWYIRAAQTLSEPSDALDGVNGWEDYIVAFAAMHMIAKEESDVSVQLHVLNTMKERIRGMASRRTRPPTHVVEERNRGLDPWDI